jgi:hypothetical protein
MPKISSRNLSSVPLWGILEYINLESIKPQNQPDISSQANELTILFQVEYTFEKNNDASL